MMMFVLPVVAITLLVATIRTRRWFGVAALIAIGVTYGATLGAISLDPYFDDNGSREFIEWRHRWIWALILAVAGTWIVAVLVGRRVARRSLTWARIGTALAVPALALGFEAVRFRVDGAARPGEDWPAMAMAGTMMMAQIMLVATIPTAWLALGRRKAGPVTDDAEPAAGQPAIPAMIGMTRDSVCMADDVHAPHDATFAVAAEDTLVDVAQAVAATGYLPMPSDAWGWTIAAGGAVVAIRPGFVRRRVVILQGDPYAVMARDQSDLEAIYVQPGSRWRKAAETKVARTSRGGSRASQSGSSGPLEPARGLSRGTARYP
ncbi:hypothetical protein [Sphingomonas montana]|uniref:hypothetical protein n=1 Tax=Sphingomonas montana TaxID=1843236 RepID=UPI00096F81E0|nr:hypothetical protein [Sphingomonas montana]